MERPDAVEASPLGPEPDAPGPRIWAVGGGKGGVGKSVVTSSLAIAMARAGERCVVIDADLGGANLHTILGVKPPRRTLAHFLSREVEELADVLCPGPVPDLWLISGAQALVETANPTSSRKERLLRQIRRLDVDQVFLDLGAGSAYNVLDFFLAAHRGILVVIPEPTSIENAYHFMKAAFFRGLRNAARRASVRETIDRVFDEAGRHPVRSPRDLIAAMLKIDPAAAEALREQASRLAPLLIVNQARTLEHRRIGRDIAIACREHLGTELEYLGALERDECVRTAIGKRKPVTELFPGAPFSRDLALIAARLREGKGLVPAGRLDDAEGTARPGRARFGELPLATYALDDGRVEVDSLRVARRAESAVPETPSLPAPAPRPPRPPLDLAEPGAYLRRCREQQGLELRELAHRIRIFCLEAIESEAFERIPPEPYIRGLVQGYARALGIPEADALAASFVARGRLAARGRRARSG